MVTTKNPMTTSVPEQQAPPVGAREVIFDVRDVDVHYGEHRAVRDITLQLHKNEITALIGPSGCGKSTFIRCLNRMNDLIPGARVGGSVGYHGVDLYGSDIDPVAVRKRIGMVFQKPNPFPKSIYDNIAFGPRVTGMKGDMDQIVESALKRAALWDEVKDRLKTNAFGMSGGQQQRLCIARALATSPDVLLMDEPCSALDPISTGRIEDLMTELKQDYSIVIVTHNMQQAARVSDMTAFFTVELDEEAKHRTGAVVEYAPTEKMFTNPDDQRTEDYVTGKFG
jgi:phosphate transport system ATP-binding protein